MRSRSALNSSPLRYLSPRRTRGSESRSVMISAELFLKSLSPRSAITNNLLSFSPYCIGQKNYAERITPDRARRALFRSPLHVFDEDAPAGARTLHLGEPHAEFVSFSPGSIRGFDLPG